MLLRNVGVYAVNEKGKCGLLKYNGMPLNAKPSFFNIDKPEFAKSFEDTTLYCDSANWEHRRILPKLINKPDESRIITWHDLENKMMPACESVEYFFYCKYVDYTEKNEQENLGRKGQFIDFPGYLYVLACKRPLSTVEVFDLLHNLEAINLSGRDALFVLDNMVKNPLRFLGKQITKVDTRIESIHRETDKNKDVLFEAKDRLLERKEMLKEVLGTTEELLESCEKFAKTAKQTNRGDCCSGVSGAAESVKNYITLK